MLGAGRKDSASVERRPRMPCSTPQVLSERLFYLHLQHIFDQLGKQPDLVSMDGSLKLLL